MSRQEMLDTIDWLNDHDVALDDLEEELDYRDRAAEGMRWNDSLYEYSDDELIDIGLLWQELSKGRKVGGQNAESNGPVFQTELGDISLYDCPKCDVQWFEFVDADEYPEYCPHCGGAFFSEEIV